MKAAKTQSTFMRLARGTSRFAGQPRTFGLCVLIILIWAALGPFFHFSDTWQLVINTSTTVITFLMVFLIQSTQNRESEATQLKLDELIRAIGGAQNVLIDLEEQEEVDLDQVRRGYQKLANQARSRGKQSTKKARAARAAKTASTKRQPKAR